MKGWLLLLCLILAGCQHQPVKPSLSSEKMVESQQDQRESTTAVRGELPQPEVPPSGSLFNARYSSLMVSDRRAYRLGDILTIELEGTTNISMGGGSSTNKSATVSIPDPTLLGRSSASILGSGWSLASDIQPTREYGGTTSSSRNNRLEGSVAVKVVEVLYNGTLRIEGNKWLTINSGREQIRISGLVRPEDISTDNKVSSERIAEARVDYVALGDNANAHEPGWFTKMLNSPFFPF